MKTISGLANLKDDSRNAVLIIGVFDGLHRGHRYLIKSAVSYAKLNDKKTLCITFYPHPQRRPCLISLKHRIKLIEELKVDYSLVINFNRRFSSLSPLSFVRDILVGLFHPWAIFVGEDFRFGHMAKGNVKLLKALSREFGYELKAVKKVKINSRIISSNRIRRLIRDGNLRAAKIFLGRNVSVLGTVKPGSKRGRILGYPTANIDPHHEVLPKEGVYAVKIIYAGKEYAGVCNIGIRPTFHNGSDSNKTIEAHIFNFKRNIYGQDMEIQFIRRIREERKFSGSPRLIKQIKEDSRRASRILRNI